MSTQKDRAQRITDVLVKEVKRRGMNAMDLSKAADIPYPTARKFLAGNMKRIPLDTAMQLAQAVGWAFAVLYNPERNP